MVRLVMIYQLCQSFLSPTLQCELYSLAPKRPKILHFVNFSAAQLICAASISI